MEKSENTGKIVGALLLGAVIGGTLGAALGILFAPEKGKVIRKRLLATGNELTGALKGKLTEFAEEVKHEIGTVKDGVNQFVENRATKVDGLK
jgi:gas vesicle protein